MHLPDIGYGGPAFGSAMGKIAEFYIQYYAAVCCNDFDGNNYLIDMAKTIQTSIREAGFEILDMNSDEVLTELGFDYTKDFRSNDHVNVYGALKVTDYLASYVRERYGLQDRRMDTSLTEWQEDYVALMNALLSQTQDEAYAENIRQRIGNYHLTYSQ